MPLCPSCSGTPMPAAQVHDVDIGEMVGELREQGARLGPVGDVENAAAGVRVQSNDPRAARRAQALASSAISARGTPNFECSPAVRTWWWCPRPVPGSTRTKISRPANTSGHAFSGYKLSKVTRTPRSKPNSYSARGAKFGVNSTRSGMRPGTCAKACASSPCDTHSSDEARGVHAPQNRGVPVRLHGVSPARDRLRRYATPRPWRRCSAGRTRTRRIPAPRSRAAVAAWKTLPTS